jgi:hypothetical protein
MQQVKHLASYIVITPDGLGILKDCAASPYTPGLGIYPCVPDRENPSVLVANIQGNNSYVENLAAVKALNVRCDDGKLLYKFLTDGAFHPGGVRFTGGWNTTDELALGYTFIFNNNSERQLWGWGTILFGDSDTEPHIEKRVRALHVLYRKTCGDAV